MLGPKNKNKKSLTKFKRMEIILNIFSDHNDIKLEFNDTKKTRKQKNTQRLNSFLLNNHQWVIREIKTEIKKYLETNENGQIAQRGVWVQRRPFPEGRVEQETKRPQKTQHHTSRKTETGKTKDVESQQEEENNPGWSRNGYNRD